MLNAGEDRDMADREIETIVETLARGDRESFAAKVATFMKQGSADFLWAAIGAAHGGALDLFRVLNEWPDADIRMAMRRLMPAVSKVTALSLGDAVQFLRFAARVPISFRHTAVEQLQPHIAAEPSLGAQLGQALLDGIVAGEGAVQVWAGAFAAGAPTPAAEYAANLLDSAVGAASAQQLHALLRYLDMSQSTVVARLEPVEAPLTARLVDGVGKSEWSQEAGVALTAIAQFSASAMVALQDGVSAGETWAIFAVAHWLQIRPTATVGTTAVPVQDLVRVMLQHAIKNGHVRRAVDSAVSSLMFDDVTRPLALAQFASLGSVDEDVAELLPESISAICEQMTDFTRALTGWLLEPDATFSAIRSLLSLCMAGQAPAALDVEMFAAASAERRVAAARRLLSLTHNGPVLCQFISVLAESPALQPDGLHMATQMLNEAYAEYPNATVEFLKERTRPIERARPFSHVYRGVYANALRWRRVLAQLPRLNELRPTDAQLHALRAMQSRVNREILRAANEHSIFAAFATKMHIAQGRRFVARTEQGLTAISGMQQASHAVELPSSELADPVRGMLRRAQALRASR